MQKLRKIHSRFWHIDKTLNPPNPTQARTLLPLSHGKLKGIDFLCGITLKSTNMAGQQEEASSRVPWRRPYLQLSPHPDVISMYLPWYLYLALRHPGVIVLHREGRGLTHWSGTEFKLMTKRAGFGSIFVHTVPSDWVEAPLKSTTSYLVIEREFWLNLVMKYSLFSIWESMHYWRIKVFVKKLM